MSVKKFVSNKDAVIKHVLNVSNERLRDFAETMTERAKVNAPYDTGNLRDSIDFQDQGNVSFRVAAETSYAAFQEFGTSKIKPKMYMARAYQETKEEFDRTPWE